MSRILERPKKTRIIPPTYCLVVEGRKTEYRYFSEFKAEYDARRSGIVTVRPANGGSPGQILQKAIEQLEYRFNGVWCVLDADTFNPSRDQKKLDQATKLGVTVIFSNPCFEVWFRLHFVKSHAPIIDGTAAKTEVGRLFALNGLDRKSDWASLRDRLASREPFENALAVRTLHGNPPNCTMFCNSSTDVDLLLTRFGF